MTKISILKNVEQYLDKKVKEVVEESLVKEAYLTC